MTSFTWRTSTRSQGSGNCVEVALTSRAVGVRDSKNRLADHLTVAPARWTEFVTGIKSGTYDH